MEPEIRIEVAGICTALRLSGCAFLEETRNCFQKFLSDKEPEVSLSVEMTKKLPSPYTEYKDILGFDRIFLQDAYSSGWVDLLSRQGNLRISRNPLPALANFLRNLYSVLIARAGGLILHACTVVKPDSTGKERAYLFLGPSGSGKTTVAGLSKDYRVLNDDFAAVRFEGNSCKSFATPYWARINSTTSLHGSPIIRIGAYPKVGVAIPTSFEIAGLFKLVKDKKTYLKRLPLSVGVAEIFTSLKMDSAFAFPLTHQLLTGYHRLLSDIPLYELHFSLREDLWKHL